MSPLTKMLIGAGILIAGAAAARGARAATASSQGVSDMAAEQNVRAFLALIRRVESNDRYDVIAGGDYFSDYSEHPFVLNPLRPRPLGTTASGAYQMVLGTWKMARDALGLSDFSPESQDAAARWILQYKRPRAWPHVQAGRFHQALEALANEWEAFAKILEGSYPVTLAQAEEIYSGRGGEIA